VNGVLRSVMGGRGKRSNKALRYLTGGHGSFLSNPATLLTAAGVAWGIYETMQGGRGSAAPRNSPGPVPVTPPGSPGPVPPLPHDAGAQSPAADDDAVRLVRLAVSAAHADGAMSERERAAILQQAAGAGVADIVEQEMQRGTPLAAIVAGVDDPAKRATLYVLAFTILRADEEVTGAERIYLAQLAHLLRLDRDMVQQLENDAGERIEALGDQGQLGG
jgi:uncharacterized membrane protein YebE (DUF533 family)